MSNFLSLPRPIDSIGSQTIFNMGWLSISNSTLSIVLISIFICAISIFSIRRFSLYPQKIQSMIEILYEAMENFLAQLTGSNKQASKLMPVIGALFFFILLSNLLGVIPGLGSIMFDGKALFRVPTADFNTTFSLALGAIIIIQCISIADYGVFGYIGRFLKFKEIFLGFRKGVGAGLLSMVDFFIGLLDIVSEIAKVVSLSLRLFGNMYAGLILGTVISTSVAYVLPSVFTALGLLSALVQAVVFTALVTVFYTLSLKPKENN